jgi:glycosyltransferase involved in cell wall biosynthesis
MDTRLDRAVPSPPGVLLVDLAEGMGGAEKRVLDLAVHLTRRGIPVVCVCLARGALINRLQSHDVVTIGLAGGKRDPRHALALARLMRPRPGWLVDAHNAQSQLWSVLATRLVRREPGVATVHSEYRASEAAGGGRWHEWVLRRAAAAGWTFVAVTDTVASYLDSLGLASTCSVVSSGVDKVAEVTQGERLRLRQSLGLSPENVVVLCAARLVAVKAIHDLVAAVGQLRPTEPQLRLVIVGDGTEMARLQSCVDLAGLREVVSFTGQRDDVERLMSIADVFALSSLTEGLPYVLLEAAAAGTAIVSTSVGAIPSTFGRECALLVPPGDPQALAGAIRAALSDGQRRREMADRARRLVEGSYSVAGMVDATLDVYVSYSSSVAKGVAA